MLDAPPPPQDIFDVVLAFAPLPPPPNPPFGQLPIPPTVI